MKIFPIKSFSVNRPFCLACSISKGLSFFRAIRQELAILVPVNHPHVVNLIGLGLTPLRLLVEFAPKGSLDTILRSYKNAGRKLDPYTLQDCIVQVSAFVRTISCEFCIKHRL